MSWLLDNARLPARPDLCRLRVDAAGVTIDDDGAPAEADNRWDLDGRLVLPGFAELHTHLDKTYAPVNNADGGLWGAIEAFRAYKAERSYADVEQAAEKALLKAISEGVTCPNDGEVCTSYYEGMTPPPGLEDVGICILPQ